MERFIGIDASLSSTAVCVMDDTTDKFYCFTTSTSKWVRAMEVIASIHQVSYGGKGSYSDSEVEKLEDYQRNAYHVIDTVKMQKGDHIFMEGYAQRASGNIVDLVVFGTFLRKRILDSGAKLTIVSPMSLKKTWAEAIYPKDKKGVARNYELQTNGLGIAGGSFKKHQMMLGLYEMEDNSKFRSAMEVHRPDIMHLANIPSPLNDCVDAFAAAYLGKKGMLK